MMLQPQLALPEIEKDKTEKVSFIDDSMQRLMALDREVGTLVFSDIQKALRYLAELEELLTEKDEPDFMLNFHLNTALIENQLYNYTLSEFHFQKAIEILLERGDASQLAEAYIDYSGTLINLKELEKAQNYLSDASKYLKTFPDDKLKARLICREGYLYLNNSNSIKALESFLEAEKMLNTIEKDLSIKDFYFIALIQSGLGSIYAQNHELEKSIEAYEKVVTLCEREGMRSRLSWHYQNVGNGYMALEDYDHAIHFFNEAIKVIDDVNQQTRAISYANLGFCYFNRGLFKKALDLMARAYPLFKEKKDYKNLTNIEWWKAKICKLQDKQKKAWKHLSNALEYAKIAEDYKQITLILKETSTWYAEELDFKNAYDYQKLYEQAIERYLLEIKASELRELEIKYEAERKEKEAEMFRLQATGLQLKALRAQMNPHFIFNALNSVQNYITSNDVNLATKYLAQFAHLMRQSLEYSELEIITLEKEIEFLKNYLDINEKLRFEKKLSYEIEIDEEIEEDIYGVPTMIVQPYVENAIEHGIRSKKNGLIRVSFKLKDENSILCIIEDNGVGREKAKSLQEKNPNYKNHRSLGTKITQERLEILLKSKNRKEKVVTITDLKDEKTGEAKGTKVEILIPIAEIQMK